MAKTRKRGGAPDWGKLYSMFIGGVITIRTIVRLALKVGKLIPEFALNQYVYSNTRKMFNELSSQLPKVKMEAKAAMNTPEATKVLKELGVDKSKLSVWVDKAFGYVAKCAWSQSVRSITEWYPLAKEALVVFKVIDEEGNIDTKRMESRKDMLSAYLNTVIDPPPSPPSNNIMDLIRTKEVKSTNPSPEVEMLKSMVQKLLTNLSANKTPRNLLKGVFEPVVIPSENDSILNSIKKLFMTPVVSVANFIIEEILYLFVVDIGNMYTEVYSGEEDLKNAILALLNKGVQMICMSVTVPIQDKDIEALKFGYLRSGGDPPSRQNILQAQKKVEIKEMKIKEKEFSPEIQKEKERKEKVKTQVKIQRKQENKTRKIKVTEPVTNSLHSEEQPIGEIAAVLNLADTFKDRRNKDKDLKAYNTDERKEMSSFMALIVDIIRMI